jgi:hypothetical protein
MMAIVRGVTFRATSAGSRLYDPLHFHKTGVAPTYRIALTLAAK